MSDDRNPLTEDNLFTAARRLVRFVRVDDQHIGGLLSNETVAAADILDKRVQAEEKRIKAAITPGSAG
jgi:hypothetical protein